MKTIASLVSTVVVLSSLPVLKSEADVLCSDCEVAWIDSEMSNGDLRFGTVSGIGGGPCSGQTITTISTATERQRSQILSILMAAAMSGKHVDAQGASTQCGSFSLVTLRAR